MPLVYRKELAGNTTVALWKIEESAVDLYDKLQLKDHEKEYIETLNEGKRNLQWLSTRVLLRTLLNTSDYIDCRIDEHGKPYLPDRPQHISLSHSYEYAAVMLSETYAVGIDIEIIKDKIERVAHKFLQAEELAFIEPAHRNEHLYACWCAKEAIYKLYGKKNVSFKDHIRLSAFQYQTEGTFNAELVLSGVNEQYEVSYMKYGEYMLGYAIKTG